MAESEWFMLQLAVVTVSVLATTGMCWWSLRGLEDARQRLMNHEHALSYLLNQAKDQSERVAGLEKLWAVAQANPELIRELAVEALKGH